MQIKTAPKTPFFFFFLATWLGEDPKVEHILLVSLKKLLNISVGNIN